MDKLWNEIKRLADSNNGFIRTSDIETAGISRMVLRKYVDAGKLEQIRKGLYTLSDDLADEFALIQVQSSARHQAVNKENHKEKQGGTPYVLFLRFHLVTSVFPSVPYHTSFLFSL